MNDNLISSVTTVLLAVVGVAIIAVLLSRNSQTGNVLQAAGNAFDSALGAATGPVTGSTPGFTGLSGALGGVGNYN